MYEGLKPSKNVLLKLAFNLGYGCGAQPNQLSVANCGP